MTDVKATLTSAPLGSAATEVLQQLFLNGPTQDGDLASKSGRSELVSAGLVERFDGWNTLSKKGFLDGVSFGLGDVKESRDTERSDRLRATAQQTQLLLSGIAAVVKAGGGEVRVPLAELSGPGACILNPDGEDAVFQYFPTREEADQAAAAAAAAAETGA